MNILMLTNTYAPHVGGVARSVEAFAQQYRQRGHRVMVVAPTFDGMPESEIDVVRVPAVQHFNGSDFSVPVPVPVFLSLASDGFNEDIIHAHHPFLLGDTALRVAALRDVPLVFTHHTRYEQYTHYVPGDSPAMKRYVIDMVTGYCNLCDAVIAPSQGVKQLLERRGVDSRIEVIPTGVDVARFAQGDGLGFRRRQGIPDDAFVIGHLGRLAPEKNLHFLAEAVASLMRRNGRTHFLLAGYGPSLAEVKAIFDAASLSERWHSVGVLRGDDLIAAYHAMDVFAFASHSETQGMVLTEAMAAGVPVVAVSAPGVDDVLRDGENGHLLPHDEVATFVEALEQLLDASPERRQLYRHQARQTAEKFSLGVCAQRALTLYDELRVRGARRRDVDDSLWSAAMRLVARQWQLVSVHAQAMGGVFGMDNPESESGR